MNKLGITKYKNINGYFITFSKQDNNKCIYYENYANK